MTNRLRISLVIPVYNEESHLVECLAAAVVQTEAFYEIIVVDNGSTDASARIARQFPGVSVLREARRGIAYARNRGFAAARGDIIARIDADTLLPPDWAAHVGRFYADGAHMETAWTCSGYFRDVPLPRLVSGGYRLVSVTINRWLTGYPALWGSSMALPVKLWRQVAWSTCTSHGIHEDLDLTTHLYRAGFRIYWDKKLRVSAQLRHAWVSRRELWEYLQWWPRTLRKHHQKSWWLCWLGGAFAMYGATMAFTWLCRGWALATKPVQEPSTLEV